MLTFFTTLKPFRDPHIARIQENALRSWIALRPRCEILILGEGEGVGDIALKLGLRHIPEVLANEKGLPFISSLFECGQQEARFPLLCYVNGDIIFFNDFLQAIQRVKNELKNFLIVGRRWDVDITHDEKITFVLKQRAILQGYSAMDYFVFPSGMFAQIPPLVVGRPGWDNWMIFHAKSRHIPLVDITAVTAVLHQNHDSLAEAKKPPRISDESAKRNFAAAGGLTYMLTLRDADWILTAEGLERPPFPRRIFSLLSLWYPWRMFLALKRRIRMIL